MTVRAHWPDQTDSYQNQHYLRKRCLHGVTANHKYQNLHTYLVSGLLRIMGFDNCFSNPRIIYRPIRRNKIGSALYWSLPTAVSFYAQSRHWRHSSKRRTVLNICVPGARHIGPYVIHITFVMHHLHYSWIEKRNLTIQNSTLVYKKTNTTYRHHRLVCPAPPPRSVSQHPRRWTLPCWSCWYWWPDSLWSRYRGYLGWLHLVEGWLLSGHWEWVSWWEGEFADWWGCLNGLCLDMTGRTRKKGETKLKITFNELRNGKKWEL